MRLIVLLKVASFRTASMENGDTIVDSQSEITQQHPVLRLVSPLRASRCGQWTICLQYIVADVEGLNP